MIVDLSAVARKGDALRVSAWLSEQRVFISSAMADTTSERDAIAKAVGEEGAAPVRFETFGRDADPEEAYLTEVDGSSIYVAVMNEIYGRPNPPDGDSATEMEYRRARERGKRIYVLVAAAGQPEGALTRFIERVRFFTTTESYESAADAADRVRRRLHELASEAVSPWIKLGDLVFRADEIDDRETTISVRVRADEEIAYQLERLRQERYRRPRMRFTHRGRVREVDLSSLSRKTAASGAEQLEIGLTNVALPSVDPIRSGANSISADDLVEHGIRSLLFGDALPQQLGVLGFMADSGINPDDLREAFELPNEYAERVTSLVVTEGLVGSGRARRVISFSVGPRTGQTRRVSLEWEEATPYVNVAPGRRRIEGDWRAVDRQR